MEDIIVNLIILLCTFPCVICNVNSSNSANSIHRGNYTSSGTNSANGANFTRNANSTQNANSTDSTNYTRRSSNVHVTRRKNSTHSANSKDSTNSTRSSDLTRSTNYTQIVTPVESFLNLISLTYDVCGYVDWCTVQTQPQPELKIIGRCCKRCACSIDCERTYSCCPDHKLIEYLNGTVFTNISLFQSFLKEKASFIDNLIYDTTPVETSQKEENDTELAGTECVRSQLKALPHVPPGSTFSMVTSCLNVSVDQRVRVLCESAYKDGLMNGTLVDFVPVQSLKTGIIYRNRHCHACSIESEAPFATWDILISTYVNSRLNGLATSVEEHISHLMSEENIQLLFEPGHELIQTLPPQLCQLVDVKTCDDRNEHQYLVTEATCQTYELPVYAMVNGTIKTYNNLACAYCGDTTDVYKCRAFYKWEQYPRRYIPFIGALTTLAYTYESLLNSDSGTNNGTSDILNKVFSPNCAAGFVHDDVLKTCRRMYCPCGLVICNSTCVPILRTVDAVYEISVKISPRMDSKHDIGNALLEYMQTVIELRDAYIIRSIYMYKSTNPKSQDHMVSLSFFARRPVDYTSLMSLAATWFNGMKDVAVDANETLSINMTIVDSYNDRFIMVDGISRKKFDLTFKYDRNDTYATRTTFKILECRFCYQMEIKPAELELLGSMIRLKRTDVYLPRQSASRMLTDSKRFALCAKHLLGQHYRMDTSDESSEEPDRGEDEDNRIRSDEKLAIAMPAFISFIVLVMCLLRYAKKHRTRSDESVGNHIELESISN